MRRVSVARAGSGGVFFFVQGLGCMVFSKKLLYKRYRECGQCRDKGGEEGTWETRHPGRYGHGGIRGHAGHRV